jgi:4-hydroxybenzoate polyprenyltransferase
VALLVAFAKATHPGPTLAVTALGGLLCVAWGVAPVSALLVISAVFLNQASVGISNDALDSVRDRQAQRREKPIVSGALSLPLAWAGAMTAAVCSLVLSLLVDPLVALWQAVFLGSGWAYNLGLKRTLWSGVCYAVGFGALPILASYATELSQFPPIWVVVIAALLGLSAHFANVLPDLAADRHQGVHGLPQRLGPRIVPGVLVLLTLVSGAVLVLGAGVSSILFTVPAALVALGFGVWAAWASRKTSPGALPFQLSMAAALTVAVGLALGL